MNGIPLPLITEAGSEQQISQIVEHLNALAQETERMFTSIDFKNLNADLANRINSSLTEHQSLEEYASSAKLEKVRKELENRITAHKTEISNIYVSVIQITSQLLMLGDLYGKYYTKDSANLKFYSRQEADSMFVSKENENKYVLASDYNELKEMYEDLERRVDELGG